jgi:RimJ/RimL family protein N-acetyltransferase
MAHPLWPLFDLRLITPELELRPLTEADLPALMQLLPPDVELDPRAHIFAGMSPTQQRGLTVAQAYWKSLGTWQPDSWAVTFAVLRAGELIGTQGLEGDDFLRLRTVDSSSFLVVEARGRGWGKQMRRGILTLAFGSLHAEYAVTSAWHDNTASLGVSRHLGYADNGVSRHPRDDGGTKTVDTMVHLRLARDAWEQRGGADGVQVTGFEPCLPLFGMSTHLASSDLPDSPR